MNQTTMDLKLQDSVAKHILHMRIAAKDGNVMRADFYIHSLHTELLEYAQQTIQNQTTKTTKSAD